MLEKLFIKWSGGDNMSELKNVELSDKQVGFVMKKYSNNEITYQEYKNILLLQIYVHYLHNQQGHDKVQT